MEDLPSEAPPAVKWKPTEVTGPWATDCPGAPEDNMRKSSLSDARVAEPFVIQDTCVVGLWESFFHVWWARDFSGPGQPIVMLRPFRERFDEQPRPEGLRNGP
eukprot:15474363-Alexandrium_andersonii.AAC.1